VPRTRFILRVTAGLASLFALTLAAEALTVARLATPGFDASTRLYSRPPVLALGQMVDATALEEHLRRIGYVESHDRFVGPGQYRAGPRAWVIGTRSLRHLGPLAAGRAIQVGLDGSGRVVSLEDGEGDRFRALPLEPELIGILSEAGGGDRLRTRLEDAPAHLVDAILTAEDHRFYRHHPDAFAASLLNALPMGFYSAATIIDGNKADHTVAFSSKEQPLRQ